MINNKFNDGDDYEVEGPEAAINTCCCQVCDYVTTGNSVSFTNDT